MKIGRLVGAFAGPAHERGRRTGERVRERLALARRVGVDARAQGRVDEDAGQQLDHRLPRSRGGGGELRCTRTGPVTERPHVTVLLEEPEQRADAAPQALLRTGRILNRLADRRAQSLVALVEAG